MPKIGQKGLNMKIKLKDGTVLAVLDSTLSNRIVAQFASAEEIETFRAELTDDNLSEFQYLDEADAVIGTYENYTFESVSYTDDFIATFAIRQLEALELRVSSLEATQEQHDDAIVELAGLIGGE